MPTTGRAYGRCCEKHSDNHRISTTRVSHERRIAAVSDLPDPTRYPRPLQALTTVRGVLLMQLLANGAGAALIFVYLRFLFPVHTEDGSEQFDLNLVAFAAYLAILIFVAVPVNMLLLRRALSWIRDGREPTNEERVNSLSQPFQQTFSAFVSWLGAAVIFGVLNFGQVWLTAGIALAGLVTCSLLYLLLERHFRPVFTLALENTAPPRGRREVLPRIMLAWTLGSAIPMVAIGMTPLALSSNQLADLSTRIGIAAVISMIAGGLVMRAAARNVAEPIDEVRRALAEVEDGKLNTQLPVDHIGEIGRLQAGFNSMVEGLRERRHIQDLFGRQVGTEVARQALEHDPELGGESRVVSIVFVDLVGFTSFAENNTPERVVSKLNSFFEIVVRVVMSEGGWVNKFEGDAALCIFGAPSTQPDHALRALRAAARLPDEVAKLEDTPRVGVGVATGHVVAGNIGTPERFEYTVIGDAVNVAARLTELAKNSDKGVLASEDTLVASGIRSMTDNQHSWCAVGDVQLRGRIGQTGLFEPCT